MTRVNIPLTKATSDGVIAAGSGVSETTADATNDMDIINDGRMVLQARNSTGGAITVTLVIPGTIEGIAITDKTVSVPATSTLIIGPFPTNIYNQSVVGEPSKMYVDVTESTTKFMAWSV